MDYLQQVVAFHRWKEVNPLPASAIALWHELSSICDKAGWPEEFTVPNAVLQSTAGLSRKEFDRARQMLIDFNLIYYKKSKRVNNAGNYTMNPFPIVQKGQRQGQQEGHPQEHGRDNGRGNFKDLSSLRPSTTTTTDAGEPQTMMDAHHQVFGLNIIPSNHSKVLLPIMRRSGEQYAVELILEAGESSRNGSPSMRYIEEIDGRWQKDGINSRAEGKARKPQNRGDTAKNRLEQQNERTLREIREAEQRGRSRREEVVSGYPERL